VYVRSCRANIHNTYMSMHADRTLDAGETGCGELTLLIFQAIKPLKELLASFTENGGKIWVCPPCFNARGLDKDNLIAGATFAGGAAVVEFLGQGAARLSY
jgi:predicted peroxiredoxin